MTNRTNGLTHHEQLRYHYLLQNLQYLNETERREFNYLHQKSQTREPSQFVAQTEKPQEEKTPIFHDPAFDKLDTLEELPLYPHQPRESKKRSREDRENKRHSKPSSPKKRKGIKRVFLGLIAVFLACVLGMLVMFFRGMSDVGGNGSDYQAAVTEYFDGQETSDGTNILVLGSDQRVTQGSTDARTDTIMVVNVNNSSGKVKLVSFMRDTLVNIPDYSVGDYTDIKLNTAFNLGEQDNSQGAEYIRQVLKHNFDIDIKYYVMVDFETFAEAINTMFPNGVEIDARFGTVDGQKVSSVEVPDDLMAKDGVVPNQTITVGKQRMDGRTLLNYARFRKDDDGDFGRTQRQQQVMSAIVSQVKDPTKLFTGAAAVGKVFAITSTNISYSFLLSHAISILSDAQKGVEQVTIPNEGDWIDTMDMYGGAGLDIDFEKYQGVLSDMGLR
ncbi:LCP family protein [Streptococcus sp. zg-JUN1979]|uniref:LCP family protein n=1 Tax=Streptococcus sp. zg-JUN1979 TaxID=3391450 RepID=UPI0039A7538C